MHGMGNDPRLPGLHREEVRLQVWASRGPKRPGRSPDGGRVVAFLLGLRIDSARLAGTFGPSQDGRRRKGAT